MPTAEQEQQIRNLDYVKTVGTQYMVGSVAEKNDEGRERSIALQYYDTTEWEKHYQEAIKDLEGKMCIRDSIQSWQSHLTLYFTLDPVPADQLRARLQVGNYQIAIGAQTGNRFDRNDLSVLPLLPLTPSLLVHPCLYRLVIQQCC